MPYLGNTPDSIVKKSRKVYVYTASAAQTVFTGSDINGAVLDCTADTFANVYLNGVRLISGLDFTLSLNSLSLTTGATANDEITIVCDIEVAVFNTYTKSETNSLISNAVSVGVNNLIDAAPNALNTLKELSSALGDDANFATTITNSLALKANQSTTYTKTEVNNALGLKVGIDSLTGAATIPCGTTAQRPASPNIGDTRFNTELSAVESYHGAIKGWVVLSNLFTATGGTVSDISGYRYHTFTSSEQFVVQNGTSTIEYLIVGGGGGGGLSTYSAHRGAGGGGAGGYISGTTTVTVGSYSIVVGAGGAGGSGNSSTNVGGLGGNSSITGATVALGGGGGGAHSTSAQFAALSGGSGGGGTNGFGGVAGTTGQGNAGGAGGPNTDDPYSGGGGGGASAVGGAGTNPSGSNDVGGAGGAGTQWLNGSYYAGGGGGNGATGGVGGVGGGGTGSSLGNGATAGASNSGGGGGGRHGSPAPNGGSGVVIIRYRL